MNAPHEPALLLHAQPLIKKLWHNQIVTVMYFMLRGYVKSGWIFLDIVFIWFLYAMFFLQFGGDVTYFYGTAGPGLATLAVLGTLIMHRRVMKASMYQTLARLTSRSAYIFGLILATGVLRILSFVLLLLLGMSYHAHAPGIGIQDATVGNMLPGAIGILLYTIFLSILTIFLLAPIATRLMQILFFSWLAALLFSHSSLTLSTTPFFTITHLPLIPITACYSLGMTQTIDVYRIIMILVMLCYIIGLSWLCAYCFKRRDLIMY